MAKPEAVDELRGDAEFRKNMDGTCQAHCCITHGCKYGPDPGWKHSTKCKRHTNDKAKQTFGSVNWNEQGKWKKAQNHVTRQIRIAQSKKNREQDPE